MSAFTWVIPTPTAPVSGSPPASGGSTTSLRARQYRALDLMIDPVTKDFVDTDDGLWAETDDSRTAVMCQMESMLNRWWGDSHAGSLLRELLNGEVPRAAELRDECLRALQALVDESVITDLTVNIDNISAGVAAIIINYTDRQSGRPADIAFVPMTR